MYNDPLSTGCRKPVPFQQPIRASRYTPSPEKQNSHPFHVQTRPTGNRQPSRQRTNGSTCAVEGITSADGRILGKMGHSERIGKGLYKNIPGEKDQLIFKSGVEYFK